MMVGEIKMYDIMKDPNAKQIIGPSDPSTFKCTEEEWAEICKKDALTFEELQEASKRNGYWHIWSPDIYISSRMTDNDQK